MIIKPFTTELIERVLALQSETFPDGWNERMMRSAFDGGRYFGYCAFDGENLIGFIACTLGLDECDLEGVAVRPEYRGKGIAKKLIASAIEDIKKTTANGFMLEVRESNIPAQKLYESLGFERISVRKKYYDGVENAVVMRKEIVK